MEIHKLNAVVVDWHLDKYGQLSVEYFDFDDNRSWYAGRLAREGDYLVILDDLYTLVTEPDGEGGEILAKRGSVLMPVDADVMARMRADEQRLISERKKTCEWYEALALAGKKPIAQTGMYGTLYPTKELEARVGFYAAIGVIRELIRPLYDPNFGGDQGREIYISEIEEKYPEYKEQREADARMKAMIAAGKRCWECGRCKIIGEFDENLQVKRVPKADWERAMEEMVVKLKLSEYLQGASISGQSRRLSV